MSAKLKFDPKWKLGIPSVFAALWDEWRPKIKRMPSRWAVEVRRIAIEQSITEATECVPYTHELMPHCVEQMDSADDPSIHRIIIWAAVRDGKTLGTCANLIGRTVTDAPRNIYSVHPIEDDVERFSEGDIEPMIKACLEGYFVEKKSRDSGRTKNFKKFHGGWIRIVNSGSLTKFRGTTVGVLLIHEADAIDRETIEKALNRTTGVEDAVIVIESTCTLAPGLKEDGSIEYRSNIHRYYDEGDKRKWFVKCRKCGRLQAIRYSSFKWPAGRMDLAACHCKFCDAPHNERQWKKMVQGKDFGGTGRWLPTAGLTEVQEDDIENNHQFSKAADTACRSYWRNGFNSLLPKAKGYRTKLHEFVAQGEAAKKDRDALKTWTNEKAAELYNDQDERVQPPAHQPLIDGREDYATDEGQVVPMKGIVMTTMTDLHGDRLEVNWASFGRDEEMWNMGHYVLFGDTNRPEVWHEWTKHLQRKFDHESGGVVGLSRALVDGGWRVDPALATLKRLATHNVPGVSGKIRVSKGVPQWQSIIHRLWATIKDRAKGIHIGTWCAKSLIYDRLRWHSAKPEDRPSAGFIHFGKCYTPEFLRQIVSETSTFQNIKGIDVETFKNPESNRNEGLDLLVGNFAAFRSQRWDFDTMEKEIHASAKKDDEDKPESKPQTNIMRGGGWRV